MKYKIINDMKIPMCVIGTWAWGRGVNGGKMIFGTSTDTEQLKCVYGSAYKNGLTMWDTAAAYGNGTAEKILGEYANKCDDAIISTKFTPNKHNTNKIADTLDNSLIRLRRDYVDIYWLHMPINIEENIKMLISLVHSGKIRNIGVSNFNLREIKIANDILKKSNMKLFGVQNHFSLLYRQSEKSGILDWCLRNEVAFFGYMVLEQGALTEKYNCSRGLPLLSRRGLTFTKNKLSLIAPLIAEMKNIGYKYFADVPQIAVAWAIAKGVIPIVGITKVCQVEKLSDVDSITLTAKEIEALEAVATKTGVSIKASWENYMENE